MKIKEGCFYYKTKISNEFDWHQFGMLSEEEALKRFAKMDKPYILDGVDYTESIRPTILGKYVNGKMIIVATRNL